MFNVGIVGATGLVGQKMIRVLEEQKFPIRHFYPIASKNSAGQSLKFKDGNYTVIDIEKFDFTQIQIALFSAGGATSKKWAPRLAQMGIWVIDNSSAWRMDKHVPLVVPEINAQSIGKHDYIIANPNCSTIQMVMALKPLDDLFGLRKVVVSTYQSVSGAGYKAVRQLEDEIQLGKSNAGIFPHPIAYNCIPHIGPFLDNGFSQEEIKMVHETQKILGKSTLAVTPTTVRVPVIAGHSESVYAEFERPVIISTAVKALSAFPGIVVTGTQDQNEYPYPIDCADNDAVFVGRIRQDLFNQNALNFWVVSDNLRKGAATNAVQIASWLVSNNYLNN